MEPTIKIDTKALDAFVATLKGKIPVARVGILGDKAKRTGAGDSNAAVGAFHEFGTENLPIRSFLRIPITDKLQSYLEKSGAFDKSVIRRVIKDKSLREWIAKIGIVAETIVADAFASGGFGKWKKSNMTRKRVHMTLVETQQLRNSITSEVSES